jgi:hypothetical protein
MGLQHNALMFGNSTPADLLEEFSFGSSRCSTELPFLLWGHVSVSTITSFPPHEAQVPAGRDRADGYAGVTICKWHPNEKLISRDVFGKGMRARRAPAKIEQFSVGFDPCIRFFPSLVYAQNRCELIHGMHKFLGLHALAK